MFKKFAKFKNFISGFIIGSVIFGTIGVSAAAGNLLQVYYDIKDIQINQVSKMPTDTKPFMYNGRTYVPLRYIAENLGQPVNWDSKTKTIYIGKTATPNAYYPGKSINYINYRAQDSNSDYFNGYDPNNPRIDNMGNEYVSSMEFFLKTYWDISTWSYVEFPLNGQFKTFKAKGSLTQQYMDGGTVTLKVFVDDNKLIYEDTFSPGEMPKDIDLDLTGAVKVKFYVFADKGPNAEFGLFDAAFYK